MTSTNSIHKNPEDARNNTYHLPDTIPQMKLADYIPIDLELINKKTREASEVIKKVLMDLGERGWFIDLSNTTANGLYKIENILAKNNIEVIDKALVIFFTKKLDAIEKFLNQQFTHRAKIISDGFKAHLREEYNLSTPIFLIQADGICTEQTKKDLYGKDYKNNYKPKTARYVEEIAKDYIQLDLLHLLSVSLPISASSASEKERDGNSNLFNRHAILHGESLAYGTQINSLKSISVLYYVGCVISGISDFNEESNKFWEEFNKLT
jgi:hypothetical protein